MTIDSETKGYSFQEQQASVFLSVSLLFCNLKISKQGIEIQFFFLERVVEILKNWAPPRQVTFKCLPPPGENVSTFSSYMPVNLFLLKSKI